MALDPTALMFREDHEVISALKNRDGEVTATGEIARITNYNEFVRVMHEADFPRDATIRDYNRTADKGMPINALSSTQRNQTEHAAGVTLWFESQSLPTTPFSADMSAALMVPAIVPDDLGDAGPASV